MGSADPDRTIAVLKQSVNIIVHEAVAVFGLMQELHERNGVSFHHQLEALSGAYPQPFAAVFQYGRDGVVGAG